MKHLEEYLTKLSYSMEEKLFFLNHINLNDYKYFYDFGCADGTIIKKLSKEFPDVNFVGYDKEMFMIEKCKQDAPNNTYFTNDITELQKLINNNSGVIFFSSVLHEIDEYDYSIILKLMKSNNVIVIRDMYFNNKLNNKIDCSFLKKQSINQLISDFENKYGKIDNLLTLYHFFLKYTYTEGWQRELNENYFGINYEYFIENLEQNNFFVVLDHKYTLAYKKQEILNNFNYNLDLPTHRNLILKKK